MFNTHTKAKWLDSTHIFSLYILCSKNLMVKYQNSYNKVITYNYVVL